MAKLYLIGNGFDLNIGLKTSFSQFKTYYYSNLEKYLKQNHYKRYKRKDGSIYSDVERVFGNSDNYYILEDDFWNSFEMVLAYIIFSDLNNLVSNTCLGDRKLTKILNNAYDILHGMFAEWISSIVIPELSTSFQFDEDSYFISFNYTETIESLFHINNTNIYHLHGLRNNPDTIVFGHTLHPHNPPEELLAYPDRMHHRLYDVAKFRQKFDKQAITHYLQWRCYADCANWPLSDINDIYVLGHSYNVADSIYYLLLSNLFRPAESQASLQKKPGTEMDYIDRVLAKFNHEMNYDSFLFGERFDLEESEIINQITFDEIFGNLDYMQLAKEISKQLNIDTPYINNPFSYYDNNPHWHLYCHSNEDVIHAQDLMDSLDIAKNDYSIYRTIEDCIAN